MVELVLLVLGFELVPLRAGVSPLRFRVDVFIGQPEIGLVRILLGVAVFEVQVSPYFNSRALKKRALAAVETRNLAP